jgi:DNA (cytosine-5)-methyltransferase 1
MYVDITKKSVVTAAEWFYGYGGNALGLKRVIPGLRSVAVCERDAFVVANMVSKMEKGLLDAVPIWTDVTDFPTEPFGCGILDLFVASYPCQGFSHAGKRLGVDDHRHLWPHCRRFINGSRPGWVWLENVEGHVTLGLSTVLADLEEDGYTAAWGIFSASEVGAPHQRKRVFILAYRNDRGLTGPSVRPEQPGGAEAISTGEGNTNELAHQQQQGLQGHAGDVHGQGGEPGGADRPVTEGGLLGGQVNKGWGVDNSLLGGCERGEQMGAGREASDSAGEGPGVWPSRPGQAQYGWEPPRVVENPDQQRVQRGPGRPGGDDGGGQDGEVAVSGGGGEDRGTDERQVKSALGGNADGPAAGLDFPRCTGLTDTELEEVYGWMVKGTNRTDELRMCGNGVVPQTAERAFTTLYAELCRDRKTERELIGDL